MKSLNTSDGCFYGNIKPDQTSVRNMESDVVNRLFIGIDEDAFKFNSIEALVLQRSDYVIQGDEYYAEIMVAGRDTTQPLL